MNVTCQTQIKYVLELTESEAQLLREVMRNPIGCEPHEEPADMRELRHALFHNLQPKPPTYRGAGV